MKEVEAGGSEIHGHSQLHRGFEANLGYVSKKKKIKGGSVGGSEVQCQAQNIMVGMGWRNRKKN